MIYYNEHDPRAAAWLEQLSAQREIRHGLIDTRSIHDVQPDQVGPVAHFFAGIGGWDYALQLAGWPDELPVWTGSCPCQPFSAAGKRKGVEDERHLWPEFRRLIAECRPPVVFGEQVASSDGRLWLSGVRSDLEALGYAVGAADLCSAGVGAPNIRQRLYWVAYAYGSAGHGGLARAIKREVSERDPDACGLALPEGERCDGREDSTGQDRRSCPQNGGATGGLGGTSSEGRERSRRPAILSAPEQRGGAVGPASAPGGLGYWGAFDVLPCLDGKARRIEPGSFPLAHGVPGRVGLLRGYGNAINPFVAAEFIRAALETVYA